MAAGYISACAKVESAAQEGTHEAAATKWILLWYTNPLLCWRLLFMNFAYLKSWLSVGTFTLSNLGMFGVDKFDAILPAGQVKFLPWCLLSA